MTPDQGRAPSPSCSGVPTRARRILIVEDDADGAAALRALFETWGHEVDVAEDGAHGIRLTLERRPDIVLVDIGLPGMNGYEVAARIRAVQGTDEPFLIAFTGWTRAQDRTHAREAGFDAYVMKPADPDRLQALVAAAPKNDQRRVDAR